MSATLDGHAWAADSQLADPILPGSLSLVIPVHNEAENLPTLLNGAPAILNHLAPRFEIVLVDDGSEDGSATVARAALGTSEQTLRVVRHERKLGYGRSVADGLRASRGEFVAFIDGDGQFDLNDLTLLAELAGDSDLVAGIRSRRADPWYRSVVSGVFNLLVGVVYGVHERDVDCGLKLFRRRLLDVSEPLLATSALLNTELFFKARRSRLSVAQVVVPHHPRLRGRRSGGRLIPILRAIRELLLLRMRLARTWHPPAGRVRGR